MPPIFALADAIPTSVVGRIVVISGLPGLVLRLTG
jgi:hypothetical protein